MKKRIILASLFLFLIVFLAACFNDAGNGSSVSSSDSSVASSSSASSEASSTVSSQASSNPSSSSEVKTTNETKTIRMMAAGDNLIHRSLYVQAEAAAAAKGIQGFDFVYQYAEIADIIPKAEIAYLNQETVLASKIYPLSAYPMFNSPVELGQYMVDIGFDVFNHATNHVLDMWDDGVIATLDFWDTIPEATPIGVYRNDADLNHIRVVERNGIKVSFVAFTYATNGLFLPDDSPIRLIYIDEVELIKSQIEKARAISDVVCVSAHWGNEDSHIVTDEQRSLAQDMVSWGADIIIGGHPHVLQPIEFIDKPDGTKALVWYSFGNLISAQDYPDNLIGGILDFNITKSYGSNGTARITVDNVNFIPTVTQYNSPYANVHIVRFENYTPQMAAEHGCNVNAPMTYEYVQQVLNDVIGPEFMKPYTP